jgi:predicted RNase H-like HicB family nuclease
MKDSARYRKIVEWSEEDQCFVGRAPDLMLGGCHGVDERAVFDELCQIVEEWIEMYRRDGKPLPPASRPETSPTPGSEKRIGPKSTRTAARR